MGHSVPVLTKGRFDVRMARSNLDYASVLSLRGLAFRAREPDEDVMDKACDHVLVHDTRSGQLVCSFRLQIFADGTEIERSYSAMSYDLTALAGYVGRIAEMGRFCIHPARADPDILRVAWGAITRFVDANGVQMLFGCSSFAGTDPAKYQDAFAMLKEHHLAPKQWSPGKKASELYCYASRSRGKPDLRKALLCMPPLLRTYLKMGGWVSDHAVVDRRMNTLHVFTGLEIGRIPPARKRLLRAMAGEGR